MQSGGLGYAYRLSAARLAIMRLRLARHWKRWLQGQDSKAHANVVRGLIVLAMLMGLSGSAWLGYRAGRETGVDPVAQVELVKAAVISQRAKPTSRSASPAEFTVGPVVESVLVPELPAATVDSDSVTSPLMPAITVPGPVGHQLESARIAELARLRKSVSSLQAQVKALEQETTSLEVELLDQQIAFAKEEERWRNASVEKRIVYNITNIPVGESVSDERMGADAEAVESSSPDDEFNDQSRATDPYDQYKNSDDLVERLNWDANLDDVPVPQPGEVGMETADMPGVVGPDEQAGGSPSDYSPPGPSSLTGPPVDSQSEREVFFGPAPDSYEDWTNP